MKRRTFSLFTVVLAGVMMVVSFGVVKGVPLHEDGPIWLPSSPQTDVFMPLTGNAMSFPLLPPQPDPVEPAPGLPLHDFRGDSFAGPALCANCHSDLEDEAGADVTNSTHWRSTMMANAARDPLYLAKVSTEVRRNPEAGAEIEATCSRCHMPMAYTQAVDQGQAPKMFGEGFLNPENQFYNEAMDGVSCALCHQIQADGLGTDASFGGHFVVDMATQFPDRALFGPYPDPPSMFASIMRAGSGYDPKQGEHMQTSSFCATCHTLFTAFAAPDGKSGLFPEQVPYLEWQHSSYSQDDGHKAQCQDCHMPVAQGAVSIFRAAPGQEPFHQHYFVGGNVFMLQILQSRVEELGLRASTDDFAATIERTRTQLQEQTAGLSITSSDVEDGQLMADVQIKSTAGHKLPSGYPSRRVWLYVTVSDASGRLIFDSGRPLPHGGINGNAADLDPELYEPHYDLITRPDQVQIYEAIMGDVNGDLTHTLIEAATYLKDNRILPLGFVKTTASDAISVKGLASDDEDFSGGGDSITYQVDVSDHTGPFTLKAELLYQTVSYQFVEDLRRDDTDEVERFGNYFDKADKSPVVIDSIQIAVP